MHADAALPCPLCGDVGRGVMAAHGYDILDCRRCGHRFAGLAPAANHADSVYGDDYFFGGGAGYDDYTAEATLLRAHGRRYADIVAPHAAPGRMLDVGAAAGFILQGFVDAGWQGSGLEPNAAMAERARNDLQLDVRTGTAEQLQPGERFDLVSMVQVIAHFTDPMQALTRLAEATQPGGLWLIETWDRSSWTARLAGRHWHEYSPPSVLHWYSRASLTGLVESLGFVAVAQGRPLKRLSGAHAKSLLAYKLRTSALGRLVEPALKLIPDSAQLPYPAEDLFWLLARKA